MKKLVFILSVLFLMIGAADVQAQWLKKVGQKAVDRAKDRAKNKVERKVDDAVDKTVDGAFDGAEDAVKGKEKKEKTSDSTEDADGQVATKEGGQQQKKSAQMSWNKFDFVAGDEVIFDDQLAGEKVGEFPSQWDLKGGYAEVVQVDGANAIYMTEATAIMPFMKEKDYLPDVFTIEFDVYVPNGKAQEIGLNSGYDFNLINANNQVVFKMHWYHRYYDDNNPTNVSWRYQSSGEGNQGNQEYLLKHNDFNRVSISFNKRAMKVYLNETRVVNIPRCDAPTRFSIYAYQGKKENRLIKNIRIAKGAVPLYDRMMSDGKFITYGITFDVGKSTIKPESMGEINRIVKLMTDNPDLKFSVEGHTDSTGNATSNQTLSEARSKAIVDKLVELGIAADRLTPSGKGQTTPIADNGTDEGRAKNRRVEFVKI